MDTNQDFKQSYDKNGKRKLSISDEKEELNEPKEKNFNRRDAFSL